MGPAGLTAVFGMGTGVTPPVWSPEMYPAGGQAGPGTLDPKLGRTRSRTLGLMSGVCSTTLRQRPLQDRTPITGCCRLPFTAREGSAPIGVVKLLGC
jgi:hypothetical protein